MTGKSSSPHPCCWVNGCHRTPRSRAWRSRPVMGPKLEGGAVGTGCGRGPDGSPILGGVPSRRVQIVAAVVGAASLGAEIAAARLLAPWFGASTVIWANTIATVLVALSAGYWVGGGPPRPGPTPARPSRGVLGAGALLAVGPLLFRPVPGRF